MSYLFEAKSPNTHISWIPKQTRAFDDNNRDWICEHLPRLLEINAALNQAQCECDKAFNKSLQDAGLRIQDPLDWIHSANIDATLNIHIGPSDTEYRAASENLLFSYSKSYSLDGANGDREAVRKLISEEKAQSDLDKQHIQQWFEELYDSPDIPEAFRKLSVSRPFFELLGKEGMHGYRYINQMLRIHSFSIDIRVDLQGELFAEG
jgi:hypothetical protein